MPKIKFKAKVLVSSEEEMEAEEKYDLGNIAKGKEWEWKNVGIDSDEIYKLIEFNKNKTIIHLYDGEKILAAKSFEELYTEWSEQIEENAGE